MSNLTTGTTNDKLPQLLTDVPGPRALELVARDDQYMSSRPTRGPTRWWWIGPPGPWCGMWTATGSWTSTPGSRWPPPGIAIRRSCASSRNRPAG